MQQHSFSSNSYSDMPIPVWDCCTGLCAADEMAWRGDGLAAGPTLEEAGGGGPRGERGQRAEERSKQFDVIPLGPPSSLYGSP